uniref:WD repeat containing, antisense to TP73 n=1 Tax=Sus scrofa TaxID=9823 RepID=A0A8D1CQN1_PIG
MLEHQRQSRVGRTATAPLKRGGVPGVGRRTTSPTMLRVIPDFRLAAVRFPLFHHFRSRRGGCGGAPRARDPAAAMNFSEVFKLSNLLCKFSPDGKYLLRITVWSLCTKSVSYIKYPKACQQGITFTRDGRYLALAERRDCRDHVSIFVCSDWQLLRHFETDTQDLAGIEWAPNGCVLAAWDTCLEYKILLYSLDGRLLSTYCAYEWSLGIKSVAWSPSSQFLAVGSYDGKVRVLNHVTWKLLAELGHPAAVSSPSTVVYREAEKSPPLALGRLAFPPPRAPAGPRATTESKYEIATVPASLRTLKPTADRANPRMGIGALAFSLDNYFLATRSDSIPSAVWIWDVRKLRLFVVLEQLSAVRSFRWDPRQPRLAICTGGSQVYLWSPAGCVSVQVPGEGDFQVLSLCWHPSGDSLALLSKDHFCLCFLEAEEGVGTALGQQDDHT